MNITKWILYVLTNHSLIFGLQEGNFSGFGVLSFDNGTNTYIGTFEVRPKSYKKIYKTNAPGFYSKDDMENGYGIITDGDGYVLEGTFKVRF